MSESLEALERIETTFAYNKKREKNCYRHFLSESKVVEEYYKDYNLVKQNLELKEQLEKEIAELKDQNAYLKEELEGWQSAYEWCQSKNSILKLENQELKQQLEFEKFDNFIVLGQKIDKLKKAIDIIKNKCVSNTNLWLVVCSRNYEDYKSFVENKDHELVRIEHNIFTQQEYNLLKGVFDNEK